MTNAPKPGSPEEAESRRNVGKGPFTMKATKDKVGQGGSVVVLDAAGGVFCFVDSDYCIGGDMSAAKARATRIAEALNRNDGLRAALIRARGIIQSERDTTVECATLPPHDDLATLDAQTRPHVEAYDRTLAEIDEALR